MRTPKEIVHEDMDSIEFTMFDDERDKTARKITDRSRFFSLPPETREEIRNKINRELNKALDKEAKGRITWNDLLEKVNVRCTAKSNE